MSANAYVSRSDRWFPFVGGIIGCYLLATLATLPFAGQPAPVMPALTPFVMAGFAATDLSTAFLLYVWFRDERTWSLLLLAGAYLYSGLMALLHLTTFPEAVVPNRSLIGSDQSAAWTFLFWTNGYAAMTLASVMFEAFGPGRRCAGPSTGLAIRLSAAAMVAAICFCAIVSTIMVDRMPLVITGSSFTLVDQAINMVALGMTILAVAMVLVFIRGTNIIYLWLSLALTAMLCSNVLAIAGGGRYTLGWSLGRLSWLLSSCILFLFFMGQFARQQRLLSQTRNTLEQNVEQRTADLQRTVRQRDLLLREVYHRVKNNLQVVDSLIAIDHRRLHDPAAKDALADLRNRVFALGLVHQQLMSSEDMETFSVAPFLRELTENLMASFGVRAKAIECSVAFDPVPVNLDFAIPLGLLTTELLTNVIKHAGATAVHVEFSRRGERDAILIVDDNGNNVPSTDGTLTLHSGTGSKIIDGITKQLEGEMRVLHQAGVRVEVSMPLPAAA